MAKINVLIIYDNDTDHNTLKSVFNRTNKFYCQEIHKNHYHSIDTDATIYDIIIFDLAFADNSCWALCKQIRKKTTLPLVVISPQHDEIYELYGFEIGIDEYIRKPYNADVLIARIEALARRQSHKQRLRYSNQELMVNKQGHSVQINGKQVELRPKEYELLVYLIDNNGIALSRDKILQDVWKYDYNGYQRTVDSHIKKIRKKMGGLRECIQTVRNYGYKFINDYGSNS
ncbi:MAG: response regulator transcription factor [Spirochaetales bacterium]|nr:response regulator transcription factor [Spirochaetales bacterium]